MDGLVQTGSLGLVLQFGDIFLIWWRRNVSMVVL